MFAGFVYVLTMFVKKQVSAFGIVLLGYVGVDTLEQMIYVNLPTDTHVWEWSPYGFFRGLGAEKSGWIIAGEILFFLLIQFMIIAKHEKSYEIF